MSMRNQAPVEHHGIASGQERSTWQILKRGVELSPELRKGIGVTIALAVLSTVGRVLVPFVVQRITDNGILAPGGTDMNVVVAYIALAAASGSSSRRCRPTSSTSGSSARRRAGCRRCGCGPSGTSTTSRCSRRTPSAAARSSPG